MTELLMRAHSILGPSMTFTMIELLQQHGHIQELLLQVVFTFLLQIEVEDTSMVQILDLDLLLQLDYF